MKKLHTISILGYLAVIVSGVLLNANILIILLALLAVMLLKPYLMIWRKVDLRGSPKIVEEFGEKIVESISHSWEECVLEIENIAEELKELT